MDALNGTIKSMGEFCKLQKKLMCVLGGGVVTDFALKKAGLHLRFPTFNELSGCLCKQSGMFIWKHCLSCRVSFFIGTGINRSIYKLAIQKVYHYIS